MVASTGTSDSASLEDSNFSHDELLADDELGAVLTGEGMDISAHIRMIRLKHSLSDWWQDPTALPSFMKWLSENTRVRADMKFKGGIASIDRAGYSGRPANLHDRARQGYNRGARLG